MIGLPRSLTRTRPRRRTPSVSKRLALVFLLSSLLAALPGIAAADVGQRLPRLTKLSEEVARGGVPLGYVPLRQIWAEYDQGDPAEVEETLHSLSIDKRAAAP